MQIEIESRGITLENESTEFIRTTVVFSSWRHEPAVERVRVALRTIGSIRAPRKECSLHAICSDGSLIEATALGDSVFEAVQEASWRLELELFRSASAPPCGEAQLFAA